MPLPFFSHMGKKPTARDYKRAANHRAKMAKKRSYSGKSFWIFDGRTIRFAAFLAETFPKFSTHEDFRDAHEAYVGVAAAKLRGDKRELSGCMMALATHLSRIAKRHHGLVKKWKARS